MALDDLRGFVDQVAATGELAEFRGVDWNLELGGIAEIVADRDAAPALLFDEIVDYPAGFRVLTNPFGSIERTKLALNADRHVTRFQSSTGGARSSRITTRSHRPKSRAPTRSTSTFSNRSSTRRRMVPAFDES